MLDNENKKSEIMIGGFHLHGMRSSLKISEEEITSKFDFFFNIQHNIVTNQLSCIINGSLDLFDTATVDMIVQRFHLFAQHFFKSVDNRMSRPIHELSMILPNENMVMQSLNNTKVSFPSATCIHHEFVAQVIQHPQKIAVELDDQSLTFAELLHQAQALTLHLLIHHDVLPGEIICQCVERSLSMVIGILAIVMVGGSYCPLSPQDPPQRLKALVNQIHSRLVIIHPTTTAMFELNTMTVNIDTAMHFNESCNEAKVQQLSDIPITAENIVFTIFTSGSTGIPKAVQVRHRNFTDFMHSFVFTGVLGKSDVIIQMARCSFDNHLLSLVGTLMTGATLVMLRPQGNMDLEYLTRVLDKKQISVMHAVPSLLNSLFHFLKETERTLAVKWLRSLCSGGEALNVKTATLLKSVVSETCQVRNHYGPAEVTVNCACHLIDLTKDQESIPLGRPLPNYRCLILDEYLQTVYIGLVGELVVGGVGIFAGYLARADLTRAVLIKMNDEIFYKTGDLVRMDEDGLIHYETRKDYQVKLRGQRIELSEIEQCLLQTSVGACIVIKWGDDHLVAYVQSSDITEEQLREHCQSYLPPHMIPSMFIILDKLPLNANGKVDRKQLPLPNVSSLSMLSPDDSDVPHSELEQSVHDIWIRVLRSNEKQISTSTNFFSIGGHSLLFIELYHRYQSFFGFNSHEVSIGSFLQQPTIFQHAQLLCCIPMNDSESTQWHTLHIQQGIASFAQERIFLDEKVRFSNQIAIYNELAALRVIQGSLSVDRLTQACRYVLGKHKILRTSLSFNENDGILIQYITDKHRTFTIVTNQTFENENEVQNIFYRATIDPDLFDLSTGRVFHCQIIWQQNSIDINENSELIKDNDVLIIGFHHAASDRSSRPVFYSDLYHAYNNNSIWFDEEKSLQYIDYSVHERLIDMTPSREFWRSQLAGYHVEHHLALPVDRRRSPSEQRSGASSIAQISLDNDVSTAFLEYASSHQVTPFQLGLATFYAFLFKLTHGDNDICVSTLNANRYRPELQNMVGMFVTTLPHRIQLDQQWTFHELVEIVHDKCLSILEHSYYPLQQIITDMRLNQSTVPFLETLFDFATGTSDSNRTCLQAATLESMPVEQSTHVAKFDVKFSFVYDPWLKDNKLSFNLNCSSDLFHGTTVLTMARRFNHFLHQIFSTNLNDSQVDTHTRTLNKCNIILPEEDLEIQKQGFCRQLTDTKEGMLIFQEKAASM
ncbi:hypothetical protein I4U23_025182 [Adineta vaga]|nr:hypothetical protein I4U23_025182 [Adineta vaga]